MNRRTFLKALAAAPAVGMINPFDAAAALPKAKITRVRIYRPPTLNPLFNQSNMVVTVETDIGITGIGEGGAKDTLEQCAGTLIGKNPFRIDAIWQEMYIAWFYPPGREKTHALGALDLALWDIKGKALKRPRARAARRQRARLLRVLCDRRRDAPGRTGRNAAEPERPRAGRRWRPATGRSGWARPNRPSATSTTRTQACGRWRRTAKRCAKAVGPDGNWCIDFHQRFDFDDALRAVPADRGVRAVLRRRSGARRARAPGHPEAAADDHRPADAWRGVGLKWDFNKLVENHDIDYIRSTLPNVGGITEMMKVAALCETHAVGIVPHFTGPIATAALVNCLSTFSGPVLMEYNYGGRPIDYLPECLDFKNGKAFTNERPGLGVTLEMKLLKMIGEVTEPGRRNVYKRPDGSLTHW